MFSKILIANRGEIACRVIKTCKRMGIATVAVYSEADADSLAVSLADEAVPIGPAASAESYLRIDKIIDAVKQTGAQAVHPGFGFLSENKDFADALTAEGIAFIGPGTKAIAAMGDKITSKQLAKDAGVSTVPGHMGLIADADEAVKISREIGYPVMIKASAGGGGKGMRVVHSDEEAREGFASAKSEAATSFGDDRVFIEKFIVEPRHIEIQVLADGQGNTLYLNERECSIQRRHQKVVEEAPSPFLDEATRKAMGEQSVRLADAVDYKSAGTVEFIVDKDRNFYFLEMNTRLQVEHPVTEMITSLDLVEQMIRVAAGEKLAFNQADIGIDGWSIETRVYAEDPLRGFLPSIGRLTHYEPPIESETVRVDTGVVAGSEISMFYDPMIAKLVVHAPTRAEAVNAMRAALDDYVIRGCGHNIAFLRHVMDNPRFIEGAITTAFIDEEYPNGFSDSHVTPTDPTLHQQIAAWVDAENSARFAEDVRPTDLAVVTAGTDGFDAQRIDLSALSIQSNWTPGSKRWTGTIDDTPVRAQIDRAGRALRITIGAETLSCSVVPGHVLPLVAHMPLKADGSSAKQVRSPMPGQLTRVLVSTGDKVEAGDSLAVVEAMKMENILRAEKAGEVASVDAEVGSSLAVDELIMTFA